MSRKKKGRGTWAHACPICFQRYEARGVFVEGKRRGLVAAAGPSEPCIACAKGTVQPWWPEAWWPRSCCRSGARLATKEEHVTYSLCSDYPWFICPTCYRTHGRRVTTKEEADERRRKWRAAGSSSL